jgi:hypothetical protein
MRCGEVGVGHGLPLRLRGGATGVPRIAVDFFHGTKSAELGPTLSMSELSQLRQNLSTSCACEHPKT